MDIISTLPKQPKELLEFINGDIENFVEAQRLIHDMLLERNTAWMLAGRTTPSTTEEHRALCAATLEQAAACASWAADVDRATFVELAGVLYDRAQAMFAAFVDMGVIAKRGA